MRRRTRGRESAQEVLMWVYPPPPPHSLPYRCRIARYKTTRNDPIIKRMNNTINPSHYALTNFYRLNIFVLSLHHPPLSQCQSECDEPYRPSNSEANAKRMLHAFEAHNNTAWMDSLPLILLCTRTSMREDTHSTIDEMMYGTTPRLPEECNSSTHNST